MSPHGGARPGAGRKPYPVLKPDEAVIDVRNTRAIVSRWQREGAAFQLEAASNWEELENDAIREVEVLGSAVNISGIYPISKELASRAEWKAQA